MYVRGAVAGVWGGWALQSATGLFKSIQGISGGK